MMFTDDELRPKLTEDDLTKLFFVRKDLSDLSAEHRKALLEKVNSLGLVAIRLDTLHLLLCLMHDTRRLDEPRFINKLFLPWCGLKAKTADHRRRISDELARLREFGEGSKEEAAHAVNLYRNVVSDLFDPYLTLVFACYQVLEGSFTDIRAADLGNSERTKYDYLLSRVTKTYGARKTFLSGYDPRVRNAVSHTGSSGVSYQDGKVVFKNIARGETPKVETVTWTHVELFVRTIELLECVQSLDICAEVFGLDCTDVIRGNFESFSQAIVHTVTPKERAAIRAEQQEFFERLRTTQKVSPDEKMKGLSAVLFVNCGERGMAVEGVKASKDGKALAVLVPAEPFDPAKDEELLAKARRLPRYAILARAVFGTMFEMFHVETTTEPAGTPRLTVIIPGAELDAYADERAGLLDLLNDSAWFVDGKRLGLEVDFNSVAAAEAASPDGPFPRKERAES